MQRGPPRRRRGARLSFAGSIQRPGHSTLCPGLVFRDGPESLAQPTVLSFRHLPFSKKGTSGLFTNSGAAGKVKAMGRTTMSEGKCKCGEPLITHDEQKRRACWECAGMAWRLNVLDRELALLEWAARKPWELARCLVRADSG